MALDNVLFAESNMKPSTPAFDKLMHSTWNTADAFQIYLSQFINTVPVKIDV